MTLKEYTQAILSELNLTRELLTKLQKTGIETTGNDEDPIADVLERAFGHAIKLNLTLEGLVEHAQRSESKRRTE